MLALSGYPLGLRFTFLEPQKNASAGQVGDQLVGAYDDPDSLRKLADSSDVVTFEFESVPEASATLIAERCRVFPPPRALEVAQDRLLEKRLFARLGIPTAVYAAVENAPELESAWATVGGPARLKSRRLGYDGHGQARAAAASELEGAFSGLGSVPCLLEREVDFQRELSILGVRGLGGELAFYPLVENHHRESILRLSLAPAPHLDPPLQTQAEELCAAVMADLDYVGVIAVELFQRDGTLLANEIAPRVHNSGHWTMDAGLVSQFANHLRAGMGWRLGETSAPGYCAMVNLVGRQPDPATALAVPGARLHLYGKGARPGRKLGHINLAGADSEEVSPRIWATASLEGVSIPPPATPRGYWSA